MPAAPFESSLSLVLPGSGEEAATGWTEHRSLEFLFRRVGGPVGVSAGFWMGGGLDGCGDGGRCFSAPGDGGRAFCFAAAGEGVLVEAGLGAGDGERFRDDGEAGR